MNLKQNPEFRIQNPESRIQNWESKMNSLGLNQNHFHDHFLSGYRKICKLLLFCILTTAFCIQLRDLG